MENEYVEGMGLLFLTVALFFFSFVSGIVVARFFMGCL